MPAGGLAEALSCVCSVLRSCTVVCLTAVGRYIPAKWDFGPSETLEHARGATCPVAMLLHSYGVTVPPGPQLLSCVPQVEHAVVVVVQWFALLVVVAST
jgi:hypothetical protein